MRPVTVSRTRDAMGNESGYTIESRALYLFVTPKSSSRAPGTGPATVGVALDVEGDGGIGAPDIGGAVSRSPRSHADASATKTAIAAPQTFRRGERNTLVISDTEEVFKKSATMLRET